MKKTLLLNLILLISSCVFAQYQGFENWTQHSVQVLDDYETTASEEPFYGSMSAFRTTDAFSGSFSIRLESTLLTQGDTIFGYFLSGDPDTDAPGQEVTIGAVDSVVGYYKCDIQTGDSALFLCSVSSSGTTMGGGEFFFSGSQATWTRFAFHIGAATSDSMLIAASTGNPNEEFNGIPGSWIQFDDIQLKGPANSQNIVNHSFENWSSITWEEPTNWSTGNIWAVGEPSLPIVKTNDSYSGNFALELTELLDSEGDTLRAIATNGTWIENGATGGVPYTASPIGVECYYKYAPSSADTAFISFQFKQGGAVLATHGTTFTSTVNTYTLWNQVVPPLTPDSLLITISAGDNIGSQLIIDDIDFSFGVGIDEDISVEKLVSFPNPTEDRLKIKFNLNEANEVIIRLADVNGKKLVEQSYGNLEAGEHRTTFDVSKYTSGVYFIEFLLGNKKTVKRFVVK